MDNNSQPITKRDELDEAVDYIKIALKDPRQQVIDLMFSALTPQEQGILAIHIQEAVEKGTMSYDQILSRLEDAFLHSSRADEYTERTRTAWKIIKEAETSYHVSLVQGWQKELQRLERDCICNE